MEKNIPIKKVFEILKKSKMKCYYMAYGYKKKDLDAPIWNNALLEVESRLLKYKESS